MRKREKSEKRRRPEASSTIPLAMEMKSPEMNPPVALLHHRLEEG
jgi:hypothetical protein